jgi:D-arabinose 1-dehydrogenase-like Zn-dependent alcohol dehydrogenase
VKLGKYAKAIVAVLIAALTVVYTAVTDGAITGQEWVQIALAGLGALGVYAIPNAPTTAGDISRRTS